MNCFNLYVPSNGYCVDCGTLWTPDSNPLNHIVAVEFDTQSDQDGTIGDHIGLNINSVKSKTKVSLDEYNINLSPPPPGANYSVWIDYDGLRKVMEVYMITEGNPKPEEAILSEEIDLKQYLKQESYFGFAASTGDPEIELNCVLKWEIQIYGISDEEDDKIGLKIGVGVGVGVGIGISIGIILVIYRSKRRKVKKEESNNSIEKHEFGKLKWLPGMPREFKYRELKKATNNFHENMKLGEGGFGIVYRGVLDHQIEVAVKKFSRDNIKGKDDFLAELTIIHRLRHKNLVRLVGNYF
ncbi:hypothetical protein JCGZ_06515 [Jatropha curcas]|uniref:non-specific serine/threonine protein kinase n=1 Tax=Jatropha curcas TaxID=180498 RepID=A0A067LED9_JATCU|nr:hypothetical protein JCGZ_06515 [Jatropha curcas]